MRADAVVAGVGGQGVLTVARLLAAAARREGLDVRQTEVHGMAQRGGVVQAMLRLADGPIAAEVVAPGTAGLVLGLEPLEALRHAAYLGAGGALVTAGDPVLNLPGYPPLEAVLAAVEALPGGTVVPAADLARHAGAPRATNIVMVGAAAAHLPLDPDGVARGIDGWARERALRRPERYRAAFHLGREAAAGARV